ncbi:MAG: cache domain-containing protein [Deltaproteobacteria bacterium]|jgi:cytochrome c
MRKTMTVLVVALTVVAFMASLTFAAATPEQAKAWVQKAVKYYKDNGKAKALAEFSKPKSEFVKGDQYIYVLDMNGKMLAHPKAALVGKDFLKVKDVNGKIFAKDMVKIAKEQGKGWVDYVWENPTTKKPESKTVYFEKVDGVIIASGAYKKK